jgi:hypothetical protein
MPENSKAATKSSGDKPGTMKPNHTGDKRIGKGVSSGPVSDEMAKKEGPSNKDTKHPSMFTRRIEDQPVKQEGTLASAKTKGTVPER